MSIIEFVHQGSFKGFPFKISKASITGGRKISRKTYPNRNDQTLEDLGLDPRDYDLSIIVSSIEQQNYFPDKEAILELLEQEGSGELVHPFFGRLTNMVAMSFAMDEKVDDLGRAILNVHFEPSEGTGVPVNDGLSVPQIQGRLNALRATQNASFAESFNANSTQFGNVTDAIDKVNDFVDDVQDSIAFVDDIAQGINGITVALSDLSTDIVRLVQTPQNLVDSIDNVFIAIANAGAAPGIALDLFTNLFGFGDDDSNIIGPITNPIRSAANLQRTINRNLLNGVIQTSALSGAYLSGLQIPATTVAQVDELSNTLDAQYEKLYSNSFLSSSIKNSLTLSRVDVVSYLNTLRLQAAEIVPVNVSNVSSRLIAFQYYNSSERGTEIASINNESDINFIDGQINILSD